MKIFIGGDIFPTELTNPLYKAGDIETLFGDVADVMQGNDVTFINLETALGEQETPIKKFGPNLLACPETVTTLQKLGVNLCGVSNNHFFDHGKAGIESSLAALNAAGMDFVGFGYDYEDSRKNYVVEKDGQKVCFIAVCEHEYTYALPDRMGCRPYDPYDTIEDIRKAKAENDVVIVIYHGGKEHCPYPSPRTYQAFHAMAKNGADVVVGQHSHCICSYENFNGSHLFYGQGNFNFIWNEEDPEGWNTAIEMIYDTKTGEVTFIPTVQHKAIPGTRLATGAEKEEILTQFATLNQSMIDGTWRDGWHKFCEEMRDYYCGAIEKCCVPGETEWDHDIFGHFLDCEAHTDVWRELFPSYNLTNEK